MLQALRMPLGEVVRDLTRISSQAQEYFQHVFAAPAHFEGRWKGLRTELDASQIWEVGADRWVTDSEVQAAKAQCASRKASRRDGIVAEMWVLAPESADWCLAVNFNARLAHDGHPLMDDPGWTDVLVRLLAKVPAPRFSSISVLSPS